LKIQQAEYAKVLREVYSLKDKAATAYYSSNFDGAESLLVSAQAQWAKVSTEADPEIEELLAIVTTVKGVAYGRVLELSDPHYPELSYSLDMGLRKSFFDRRLTLAINGRDLLDSRKWHTQTSGTGFSQDSEMWRGGRRGMLQISWSFGNMNGKKRMQPDQGADDEGGSMGGYSE